jgi:hypothetical protein
MTSFAPLQQHRIDPLFTADVFDLHLPGAFELVRFWLENVARSPPKQSATRRS